MMRISRYIVIAVFVLLLLGGCRYRIVDDEILYTYIEVPPVYDYTEYFDQPGEYAKLPTPDAIHHDEQDEPPVEYIPLTSIEATPDDFAPQTIETVDDYARQYGTEENVTGENGVGVEAAEAEDTFIAYFTEIEADAVIGDDGGVVGIVAAYSTFLRQGVNAIYPCQLLYIYTETEDDLQTIGRGSAIYQLMVNSGGLNVSSRLSGDNLAVTADWVVRRNPDAIVKFVDDTILGSEVANTIAASGVRLTLAERPDWGAINAIRNNRVILLSAQMLDSEETELAAKLLIANLLYPELFEGIDVFGTVADLMIGVRGIHYYLGG